MPKYWVEAILKSARIAYTYAVCCGYTHVMAARAGRSVVLATSATGGETSYLSLWYRHLRHAALPSTNTMNELNQSGLRRHLGRLPWLAEGLRLLLLGFHLCRQEEELAAGLVAEVEA